MIAHTKKFKANFWQHFLLAYPIMFGELSYIAIGVADTIMVGWLGAASLAAVGLANSIIWPFFAFCMGVSYGMTPLIAAADAKHHYQKIGKILQNALLINTSLSVLFFAIIAFFSFSLYHVGQPIAVACLAEPYLCLIAASLIPFMLFQTLKQYTEGLSLTKPAMYIHVFCSIVNIVLNYLFIYGKLGIPAMGLQGAGLATLCSRMLMAFLLGGYVWLAPQLKLYIMGCKLNQFSYLYACKILKLGIFIGLEWTFGMASFTVATVMMGWISANAQAAHTVVLSLRAISHIFAWSIGQATTIRIGNQFGMRNRLALRQVGCTGFMLVGIFMMMTTLAFILAKHDLPALYTNDSLVLGTATSLLAIIGWSQLADGAIAIGVCALRGIEDTFSPFVVTMLAYWLVGIPLGYFFAFNLDLDAAGVWWGLSVRSCCAAVALLSIFYYKSKNLFS